MADETKKNTEAIAAATVVFLMTSGLLAVFIGMFLVIEKESWMCMIPFSYVIFAATVGSFLVFKYQP